MLRTTAESPACERCVTLQAVYELRPSGIQRFILAPFAGLLSFVTIVLVVVSLAGGWVSLAGPIWLTWVAWRASRLKLRADASGVTIVNLVRRYEIRWPDVRGSWADERNDPPAVIIERRRGRFWHVAVHATFGLGKERRRQIALEIAALGREFGYGFPAGDEWDLDVLPEALFHASDPALHQAWWESREPTPPRH